MSHLNLTKWTFLVLGTLTMLFGVWWGFRRWNALVSWPTAQATVVSSEISQASGVEDPNERIYANVVRLRFGVDGHSYEVKVNDWGQTNSASYHQKIASRYAVGSRHVIRYRPGRPENIYVEAGYTFSYFKVAVFFLALGGLFAGIGALLLRVASRRGM